MNQNMPVSRAGGSSGGSEARLAKLEAHVDHIRGDLGALSGLPVEVATLKVRIEMLPSKTFIVTAAAVAIVAGCVGVLTLLERIGVIGG